jgi:hypothetical protein
MTSSPVTVPAVVAGNDTTAVAEPFAASGEFGAGALTVSTPVIVTLWIVVAAPPTFVMVIVCWTGSPTRVVGKTVGLGDTWRVESMPVHVIGIEIVGCTGSLLEIVIEPFAEPTAAGSQTTEYGSDDPAPRLCEVVVPDSITKPLDTATDDTVAALLPLFVTVTATGVESLATRTWPNAMLVGDAEIEIGGAVPVPLSVYDCVPDVDVIVRTQLTSAATVGWNVALNE